MKVILITDTHFGLQNDNSIFHDNMQKFYDNVFFPYLNEHRKDIDCIIHLGDVYHSRKKIDTNTLKRSKDYFFDKLWRDPVSIILGNHDIYYKNSAHVNSPALLLEEYENINIYDKPHEFDNILFIPWITKENADETLDAIKKTKCNVVMGHLELQGFKFNKNQIAKHGMKSKIFDKFDRVFSGHYHSRSTQGHITYLGAPTQHTWIDVDEKKGFHVFDTETLELTFIENPYNMYENIHYEEDMVIDEDVYKDKIIKLHSSGIESRTEYEKALSKLEDIGYNVKTNESKSKTDDIQLDDIEVEDTSEIIKHYIVQMEDIRHENVYKVVNELYMEASTI